LLGDRSINVNSLHVGQEPAGEIAVTLWNLAAPLAADLLRQVRDLEDVISADAVSL